MKVDRVRASIWGLVMVLALTACARRSERAQSGGSATGGSADVGRGTPKVLTIAVQRELKDFARFTGSAYGGGQPGSGNSQVAKIAHNYLAIERPRGSGVMTPQIAAELPSVEKGTWVINP